MSPLNTPQRVALAIAGAAILLFQITKIADDGIEGVGWIFAIFVGSALLLPLLHLLGRTEGKPEPVERNTKQESSSESYVPTPVDRLVARASNTASRLHRQLPTLMDFPAFQSAEFKQIADAMHASWKLHCIAYCGSLSLMAEWKRNRKFVAQPPFNEASLALVPLMIEAEKEALRTMGALAEFDQNRSHENCLRDVRDSNKAMMLSARLLNAGYNNADAGMLGHFADKINIPPPIRDGFYENMRKFNKTTLTEYLGEA